LTVPCAVRWCPRACNEPPEHAYFNEQVRPLLTENDHVCGQVDAVSKRRLLAGARCLLFPIQWEEPFGMSMIEAMACGTPVVALRGGAVPEVMVDGVTGVVCDRPIELPAAIERAQTMDPVVCRRHVAAHFGNARFGSGYEAIYRTVVGTGVSASRQAKLRQVLRERSNVAEPTTA
jgi:glycosyltransferase involved in cell wall biosynthesis